ncbi:PC-esterase domain-containing protein 1A-like isoform X2 [Varanus komodoensis]|uniref:PC-esterase domain-containing protein 1A-like isoform X2 n=1 Tax=Varanus komodoensis TaxID=61221 RepID=UPI001CF7997C|nr:PC-esterase domain-containing protein 1A-like isoform X2 [Varanus komodoensis]
MRQLGIPLGDIHDFSTQEVQQLLHNKFVVIMGDSNSRSIYKDLIYFLQTDEKLTLSQLKGKGEESFANDCRVEFRGLKNGPSYREARQYRTSHHLVRFYFITRVYSAYVESILSDFKKGLESGLAPDVIVMSSCLWDLNVYQDKYPKEPPIPKALREYRENLEKLFARLDELLPSSCLIIWATAMPIRETTSGSCFRSQYKSTSQDVIEANFYSATLACCFGFDVLDLHYCLRLLEELHARDGVHWNYWAHRCISKLLLTHVAGAWGVELPKRTPQAGIDWSGSAESHDFCSESALPQVPLGQLHCSGPLPAQPGNGYFGDPLDDSKACWETPADFPHNASYRSSPMDRSSYEWCPLPLAGLLLPSNSAAFSDNAHLVRQPEGCWGPPAYPGQPASFHFDADLGAGPVDGGDGESLTLPRPAHVQPGYASYFPDDRNFANEPTGGSENHHRPLLYAGLPNPGPGLYLPFDAAAATATRPEGGGGHGQRPWPSPGWLPPLGAPHSHTHADGSRGPWSSFGEEQGPLPPGAESFRNGLPGPGPRAGGAPWPAPQRPRRSHGKGRAGRRNRFLVRCQPPHSLDHRAHPYARPQEGPRAPRRRGSARPSRRPQRP